nr:MAG TPA: hypothetical protein [Caudoviricetes sp.]
MYPSYSLLSCRCFIYTLILALVNVLSTFIYSFFLKVDELITEYYYVIVKKRVHDEKYRCNY